MSSGAAFSMVHLFIEMVAVWLNGNILVSINTVTLNSDLISTGIGYHVPPRLTKHGRPSVHRCNEYQEKLGSK